MTTPPGLGARRGRVSIFVPFIAAALGCGEAPGFAKPEVFRFGASVAEMELALTDRCESMTTRRIDPPFLEDIENEQLQIDCDGFPFRGQPRWVEVVIGDDAFEMVWVMMTAEEESSLLTAMVDAYGEPTHESADYFAFVDHRAALRRDIPEVLFYSEALAPEMREFFDEEIEGPGNPD